MKNRPIILSVAGLDPSAGAGLLADIKTAEQHKVTAMGVLTSITFQTENKFLGLDWLSNDQLSEQINPILAQYTIQAIKIGLIQLGQMEHILALIPQTIPIIWDPILHATAGFDFENGFDTQWINKNKNRLYLITPNKEEYQKLELSPTIGCNILLKGGHFAVHKNDILYLSDGSQKTILGEQFDKNYQKHGSGCILSAAIASNLALGYKLPKACILAKKYVERVLVSNNHLLGYHCE